MKKAKHLSLISWKEFVLKSGKTENQELPGNLPNIGSLFDAVTILRKSISISRRAQESNSGQ